MLTSVLIIWLLFGVVTGLLASTKGRSGGVWFLVGLILGPIGLILVLLAPRTKLPPP